MKKSLVSRKFLHNFRRNTYFHGYNQPDSKFAQKAPKQTYQKPVQKLGAHVASLGMIFYQGKMFPKKYRGQIFIAEHGSWNRSKKSGYRISLGYYKTK